MSLIQHHQRFWYKVIILNPNDCWNWTQYLDKDGYGSFYYDGTAMKAHRASYELQIGSIPQNMCVCHTYDNPSCVNPSHLFIGYHDDNMKDMKEKGRSRNSLGQNNTNTNLTDIESELPIDRFAAQRAS